MFRKRKAQQIAQDAEADFVENPEHIAGVLGQFPKYMAKFTGRLPFARKLWASYYALLDNRTPLRVKATLAAALAYFILPTDAIPDIVAGLGYTDDAAVLMLVLNRVRSSVMPEHYAAAERAMGKKKRRKG